MADEKASVTIQLIVEQYQKKHPSLSDNMLRSPKTQHSEFIIGKCVISKGGAWIFGLGDQCLLFINKDQSKKRLLIGYVLLAQPLSKTNSELTLEQFIQKQLIIKSKYIDSQVIADINYQPQSEQIIILLKAQNKRWKLAFQSQNIAKAWQKQLKFHVQAQKNYQYQEKLKSQIKSPKSPSITHLFNSMNQGKFFNNPLYNPAYTLFSQAITQPLVESQAQKQIKKSQSAVYQMAQQKTKISQEEYTILKDKLIQLQKELMALKEQRKSQEAAYKTQYNQLKNQLEKSMSKVKELQLYNKQLISQVEGQKMALEQSSTRLSEQIERSRTQIQEKNNLLSIKTLQHQKLQVALHERLRSISRLQFDKETLQQKLAQNNSEFIILQSKVKAAQSKLSELNSLDAKNTITIVILKQQITKLKDKINQQQIYIQKLLKQNQNLQQKQSQQQLQIRSLSRQLQMLNRQAYLHIFEGQVLHNCPSQKQFLRNTLQRYSKRRIEYTRLLYRYDNINKANFHRYIDSHSHICLVLRLHNGMLIAGYSQDSINPEKIATKGGLVCSLTAMDSFELVKGSRSVTYDDFFLIFGNSELRIRWGELLLFSNFGIANGYYDSRGEKHTVLMGNEATRSQSIECYQVFEVVFR